MRRETVKFAETVVAAGVPSLQQAEEAQEGGLIGAQAAQDTVNSDELVATLTPVGDEVESVASKIQPCWRHYTNRSCLEKAEEEVRGWRMLDAVHVQGAISEALARILLTEGCLARR